MYVYGYDDVFLCTCVRVYLFEIQRLCLDIQCRIVNCLFEIITVSDTTHTISFCIKAYLKGLYINHLILYI